MRKNSLRASQANNALIQARKLQGWKEEDIATQISVDKRTYCRWEKGQLKPSLRHLRFLCELFQTTPELLGFDLER